MAHEVVEPIADVRRGIEAEQPSRGRVEPDDLVLGVQNDAGVAERPRALANLAQQTVILLLTAACLRANLFEASEDLDPESARLEDRRPAVAVEHAVEQEEIAQNVDRVESERAGEPPARPAEPQSEQ